MRAIGDFLTNYVLTANPKEYGRRIRACWRSGPGCPECWMRQIIANMHE
jgi:hypothetical protein